MSYTTTRMTGPTKVVLAALLNAVHPLSGSDIARATTLMSGTLYPILHRLEKSGWIRGADEDVDPAIVGRPRRRLYALNPEAIAAARTAISQRGYWSSNEVDSAF